MNEYEWWWKNKTILSTTTTDAITIYESNRLQIPFGLYKYIDLICVCAWNEEVKCVLGIETLLGFDKLLSDWSMCIRYI
jgi:hypothetical protein